ncbi:hypothetical protein G9P44_000710 [Scheffersomyces stipitis]|nr:hypothetical protein G9P44_000710 [Scheffersomyces stipitis]
MNDYGGLGIVLEEKESAADFRSLHRTSGSIHSNNSSKSTKSNNPNAASNASTTNNNSNTSSTNGNTSNSNMSNIASSNAANLNNLNITSISSIYGSPSSDKNTIRSDSIEAEVLLPPLPDEDAPDLVTNETRSLATNEDADSDSAASSYHTKNHSISQIQSHNQNQIQNQTQSHNQISAQNSESSIIYNDHYSEFFQHDQSFSNYALDSPSLVIDSNFQLFPSLSSQNSVNQSQASHAAASSANTTTDSTTSVPTHTSPLKRLKSIKNGIRKLSLSSSKENSSNSTKQHDKQQNQQQLNRPILSPLQVDLARSIDPTATSHSIHHSATGSHSSTSSSNSSLSSVFNNSTLPSVVSATHNGVTNSRPRTLSNSASLNPITPPLTSPVITISENLSATKKTLSSIDQNYIDSLNTSFSNSLTISTRSSSNASEFIPDATESESLARHRIESISELSSAQDLISYASFLDKQKKSITDAFELTRSHLIQSGWCSDHDLNNLQLQQDSSLSQLDTKLIQIEERLNREFGVSLLTNVTNSKNKNVANSSKLKSQAQRVVKDSKEMPISPSLKVLESRCFSFTDSFTS